MTKKVLNVRRNISQGKCCTQVWCLSVLAAFHPWHADKLVQFLEPFEAEIVKAKCWSIQNIKGAFNRNNMWKPTCFISLNIKVGLQPSPLIEMLLILSIAKSLCLCGHWWEICSTQKVMNWNFRVKHKLSHYQCFIQWKLHTTDSWIPSLASPPPDTEKNTFNLMIPPSWLSVDVLRIQTDSSLAIF